MLKHSTESCPLIRQCPIRYEVSYQQVEYRIVCS
jgi:hypothetical protein